MKKKLTKKQIKDIAELHTAIRIANIESWMFDEECDVTDEDQTLIIQEINKIAIKLAKNRPMNLGGTVNIINYFK